MHVCIHIWQVFLEQFADKLASLSGRDGVAKTPCNLCGKVDEDLGGHDGEYSILISIAFYDEDQQRQVSICDMHRDKLAGVPCMQLDKQPHKETTAEKTKMNAPTKEPRAPTIFPR
jgi:hypothetical protein